MRHARRLAWTFALLTSAAARAAGLASLQQPAVSPDGKEVAFAAGGAIWTVAAAGGDAHPLIADLGDVSRPLYSPDGKQLAFISTRTGNGDVYVLTFDTGDVRRVTYDDGPDRLEAWSPDGKRIYYSSGSHEVGGTSDVYRVPVNGGTPMAVVAEPFGGTYYVAPAPDGKTVAVCGGGMGGNQWWRHGHAHIDCDAIWTTADGKQFTARTNDTAKHLWPMWAPDGRTLYCMSDDDGSENLYAIPIGQPTTRPAATLPLTHFRDGRLLWPTISADGTTIVFERDFGVWTLDTKTGKSGPVAVRLRGAVAMSGPQRQTFVRDASEAVVSHDGRKVAVIVRGQVFAAPVLNPDGPQPAFRVTKTDAIEGDIVWSADDRRLAYTSTRDGPRHVYLYDFATRSERRLTDTPANDSQPSFAPDDASLAYVRDGNAVRVIDFAGTAGRRRVRANPTTRPATAPATTTAVAADPATTPAVRRLLDQLDANDAESRRVLQARRASRAAAPTTTRSTQDVAVVLRLFRQNSRIVAELSQLGVTVEPPRPPDRLLAGGLSLPQPPYGSRRTIAWAPAGDYVAVTTTDAKGFRNAYLIPAAGGTPRPVSFLANAQSTPIAWTPDGSAILFATGQRTEDSDLARVDLKPRTPTFRNDQFRDLFRQRPTRPSPEPTNPRQPTGDDDAAGPASTQSTIVITTTGPTTGPTTAAATRPSKTEVVFDDVDQRLSLLPVGLDTDDVAVSPDGKWAGLIGSTGGGGRANVYLYSLDPLAETPVPRQMTATAEGKSDLQFAPDPTGIGTRLYFREGGRLRYVPVPSGRGGGGGGRGGDAAATPSPDSAGDVTVPVEMDVSFDRDKRVAFEQAWRTLADHFHDPAMHGLDWSAVRDRFLPRIAAARTPADERRLLSLMIGELNSSHTGVTAPRDAASTAVGRLGVTWDAAEYDRTGKLRVAAVLAYGPAALAGVKPGQFVATVDAALADRPANLDQLLENKSAKDVTLGVADTAGGTPRDVRLMTVSAATERQLAYKAWVNANKAYVAKASGGRLGYVHLADMDRAALARLSADLDARAAALDGVVVDVRNNNGGFVNGYALDVFTRRNYVTLQGRDSPRTAGRVALGQRYLGLPTVLVTNRMTLSDGEDFTEGYQALGLGDTVGEPTAGWIIFTGGVSLLDGTGIRLPSETVYDHAGGEMEMHPRPVTTLVVRPVGEATAGRDSQLDAAVKDLLGKLAK